MGAGGGRSPTRTGIGRGNRAKPVSSAGEGGRGVDSVWDWDKCKMMQELHKQDEGFCSSRLFIRKCRCTVYPLLWNPGYANVNQPKNESGSKWHRTFSQLTIHQDSKVNCKYRNEIRCRFNKVLHPCWNSNPGQRPNISKICSTIDQFRNGNPGGSSGYYPAEVAPRNGAPPPPGYYSAGVVRHGNGPSRLNNTAAEYTEARSSWRDDVAKESPLYVSSSTETNVIIKYTYTLRIDFYAARTAFWSRFLYNICSGLVHIPKQFVLI